MATFDYDQLTGQLKEVKENTSVADRVTGLMQTNSPLMKQARTTGNQQANRRGLLSSTMGIQAAESEAYRAAVPIASQEAAEANQRVMQARDITNQRSMLEMEVGSRERMQLAEQAAQKERLGMQITSQERMALQDLEAAKERLGMQLTSQNLQQNRDIISREQQNSLDRAQQDVINQRQVNAGERQNAASMITNFEQIYSQTIASIMNNGDLPAATRQQYMDHAAAVRDNNIRMVEQMYGFSLNWSGGTTPVGNNNQPQPAQPSTATPAASSDTNNTNIYNAAKSAGMTPEQVAGAYGFTVDEVNAWLTSQGLSL